MTREKNILRWLSLVGLVILFEISSTYGDNSVYILSKYRQRVTSSTLNWLPIAHYEASKEIVIGGFERQHDIDGNQAESAVIKERSLYVCRVFHNGVWVAGKQTEGEKKCTVTYLGNVASYERYDLLENVDNSARLSWLAWDKFHQTPIGAVATESMFVARHVVTETEENDRSDKNFGYTHYIGTYDSSERLGRITYVKDNGEEGTAESGEILVETEPRFYELNAVKLNSNRKRILKRIPRVLRTITISNRGSESAVFAEALDYTFNHSIYWGQGHVMIKALNTSITLAKGQKLGYVSWGLENKSEQWNATTVEIRLEPGTAVNVTLRANYTDMESPYMGELVSVYEDGERRSRMIGGQCREETMMDVKVEFGPIYFLNNMSLVPTTVAPLVTEGMEPSTTLKKKTTKEPTYTSVKDETYSRNEEEEEGQEEEEEEEAPEVDENLIVPPRKSDTTNMQNDDGGPLSLKNKVEGTDSSSTNLKFNYSILSLVLSIVIAFYRIT